MNASDVSRAVEAGVATASALDLRVDTAIVLHDSNRIAVRLLPSDVLARVAPAAHQPHAELEVAVARHLAATGSPVAKLDPRVEPRVHLRDGFAVTLWTYYQPLPSPISPPEYAQALMRLHVGMKQIERTAPHFTDRVAEAQSLLGDRTQTPGLVDADRKLLNKTLQSLTASITSRGANEQLLHGEPHPGNVLNTKAGPLFVDFETCCRGPVEFDIAHAPEAVSEHYPAVDEDVLRECRILMLAMITTWRWDRNDQFPHGRQRGAEWLGEMRAALDRNGLDVV
jgi:aminoglycoside phosphotransferase (APT) family kinase protein